ncbi:MAG TPA: hypothetical protein HA254_06240 [Candidatus Diapherotrites archaeon]|uniref:Uncharacterized protein n=1 Tax=Candidatus Iainarchaeum sp. TaxID=3101447 RepID=A0A7J4J1G3_9ARCH|nr:hypothetical protein [Candidatus Diapherotrites archaeon]
MGSNSLKALFLLLLFYVALYVLSNFIAPLAGDMLPLKVLEIKSDIFRLDYMLWLVPASAFFFVYLLLPLLRSEMGFGGTFVNWFPLIFFIACYIAYFVAIYWFYDNQAVLSGVKLSQFNLDFLNPLSAAYWKNFAASHFFFFVLAGIGGWVARMVIENFLTDKPEQSALH